MPTSTDNSALDQYGNLKDASDMKWYHSEDNEQPLPMPKENHSGLSSKGGSLVLLNLSFNYIVKTNLWKAPAVPVEMITGHHKIQPSARAKHAAGLSSDAELCA